MTMKKMVILFYFILLNVLFGMKEKVELNVKVTARVVESLKIQEVETLKVNEELNGDIDLAGKIRTNGAGRVLVTWRENDEIDSKELQENQKISLDTKNEKVIADIRMPNMERSVIDLGEYKERLYGLNDIKDFSNRTKMGEKSGNIVVNVEYIGKN